MAPWLSPHTWLEATAHADDDARRGGGVLTDASTVAARLTERSARGGNATILGTPSTLKTTRGSGASCTGGRNTTGPVNGRSVGAPAARHGSTRGNRGPRPSSLGGPGDFRSAHRIRRGVLGWGSRRRLGRRNGRNAAGSEVRMGLRRRRIAGREYEGRQCPECVTICGCAPRSTAVVKHSHAGITSLRPRVQRRARRRSSPS